MMCNIWAVDSDTCISAAFIILNCCSFILLWIQKRIQNQMFHYCNKVVTLLDLRFNNCKPVLIFLFSTTTLWLSDSTYYIKLEDN